MWPNVKDNILSYLQVNSKLLFTSHGTIASIYFVVSLSKYDHHPLCLIYLSHNHKPTSPSLLDVIHECSLRKSYVVHRKM